MVNKFRSTLQWSGTSLALVLLAACAGSPPQQEVEPEPVPLLAPPAEPAAYAPPPAVIEVQPDHPESYTVVRGDTLWDISARFLKDPWMWPHVWHVNPQVVNPHLIYPGDVLTLYFVDGKPVIRALSTERPYTDRGVAYGTERLSPRIREESLDQAIHTIPLDMIRPFLTRHRVVTDAELKAAPYVVANDEQRLMVGDGFKTYVRGIDANDAAGMYDVVRRGEVYRDPQTGAHLGIEALYLGDARLTIHGDPSTLQVTSANREILRGDRLFPKAGDALPHRYMPRAPANPVSGQIISVIDGVAHIGQHQIVVLNLGTAQGIEPGHVLAVSQRGARVKDTVAGGSVDLPDERAGIVMVFRTFERVSYALVMSATKPLALKDRVANP